MNIQSDWICFSIFHILYPLPVFNMSSNILWSQFTHQPTILKWEILVYLIFLLLFQCVFSDLLHNLFKELEKTHDRLLTVLITLIAARNIDTGNSLFTKQHKLMMSLVLAIVLYSFFGTLGTILRTHNNSNW